MNLQSSGLIRRLEKGWGTLEIDLYEQPTHFTDKEAESQMHDLPETTELEDSQPKVEPTSLLSFHYSK